MHAPTMCHQVQQQGHVSASVISTCSELMAACRTLVARLSSRIRELVLSEQRGHPYSRAADAAACNHADLKNLEAELAGTPDSSPRSCRLNRMNKGSQSWTVSVTPTLPRQRLQISCRPHSCGCRRAVCMLYGFQL